MVQTDLFDVHERPTPAVPTRLDLPNLLERIATVSARPRYAFMVLNLIARAAAQSGRAGPYVEVEGALIPIRDWLSDALAPMAQRDPRRLALAGQVREELQREGRLASDEDEARRIIDAEVRSRMRRTARTNVSHAVSELVKAGLVRRYYEGFRVDHHNRGAQRQAVYLLTDEARAALSLQQ